MFNEKIKKENQKNNMESQRTNIRARTYTCNIKNNKGRTRKHFFRYP